MWLARKIVREKTKSTLKILIMSIGLASSLVLFYITYNAYHTDNFYRDKDRIYQVFVDYKSPDWNDTGTQLVQPFVPAMRRDFPDVEAGTVIFNNHKTLFLYKEKPIKTLAIYADSLYLKVFQRKILAKNTNALLSRVNTAVVTKAFAEKYLGGTQAAVSKIIRLNGTRPIEIEAVIEDWPVNSSQKPQVILSFATLQDEKRLYMGWDGGDSFQGFVKLHPQASAKKIEKNLPQFLTKYVDVKAEEARGIFTTYHLIPLSKAYLEAHPFQKTILRIMLLVGILILGLISFNILLINLSDAQAFDKNITIRRILGAENPDLLKQSLIESLFYLLLTALIAFIFIGLLNPFIKANFHFNFFDLLSQPASLWIVFIGLLLIFLINFWVPFNRITQYFSTDKKTGNPKIKNTFQKTLLMLQIGITFSLFVFLYFMHAQLSFAEHFDKSYQSDNLAYITLNTKELYQKDKVIKKELQKIKNIESVSLSDAIFTQGLSGNGFFIHPEKKDLKIFRQIAVDKDFFNTMKMPVQGKVFSETGNINEIIINREIGKMMHQTNPVGQNLYRDGERKIIGVVPDFITQSIHSKKEPTVFVKYNQASDYSVLSIRIGKAHQKETLAEIKRVIGSIVPDQYVEIRYYDEDIQAHYQFDKNVEKTIGYFALLALLISISGLIGFSLNMVSKRTKEIGIRKVNGASGSDILLMINRGFLPVTAIALLFFIPISYYLTQQWLQNFAYTITLRYWIFIVAAIFMTLLVLLIVSMSVYKTSRINPVKILKYE